MLGWKHTTWSTLARSCAARLESVSGGSDAWVRARTNSIRRIASRRQSSSWHWLEFSGSKDRPNCRITSKQTKWPGHHLRIRFRIRNLFRFARTILFFLGKSIWPKSEALNRIHIRISLSGFRHTSSFFVQRCSYWKIVIVVPWSALWKDVQHATTSAAVICTTWK